MRFQGISITSFRDEEVESTHVDVLVKGGDYSIEEIVGSSEVKAYGGDVQVLPYFEGLSTTAILDRIATRRE